VRDFFDGVSPLTQEQLEMSFVAVKAMRGIFGLTQGDLARLSGVSKPTISRLETGSEFAVKPETLFLLIKVAVYLGLDLNGDENGLIIRLSIKGIDRSTCTSPSEAQLLQFQVEDLGYIIERMKNDWGSDASPKKLAECIAERETLLERLNTLGRS